MKRSVIDMTSFSIVNSTLTFITEYLLIPELIEAFLEYWEVEKNNLLDKESLNKIKLIDNLNDELIYLFEIHKYNNLII